MNPKSQHTLLRRFGWNSAAQGYAQLVTVAVQFIQIPLFLHFWGVEKYGEWIVLAGIPLSLAILDLGVTQASASKSAMEAGRQAWSDARDSLAIARIYAVYVGLATVALVFASTLFVDWAQILKLSLVDSSTASVVLVTLALAFALNLQGGFLDAWMRAYNQAALSGFIVASLRVVETLMLAVLLSIGCGFVGASVGILSAAAIVRVVHATVASRRASAELSSLGSAHMAGFRAVVKPASGFIAMSLTQVLTIQGGIQVLNQLATPALVVAFSMTRTLTRLVLNLGMLVNNALRPQFSLMLGAGDRQAAVEFLLRIWRLTTIAGVIAYLGLVLIGPTFLQSWSGGRVVESHWFVAMVGLHAIFGLVWHIPAALEMAENKHVHYALYYAGSAIVSMALWLVLSGLIQPVVGAALLLALPELVMALVLFVQRVQSSRDRVTTVP